MANVFRQFLLDVEHGDLEAIKRNIDNGIDLETRDEVRNFYSLPNHKTFINQFRMNKQLLS